MIQRTESNVNKFLHFWASKGGFVTFGVFFFSFVFTLLFGNYPQWKAEEYNRALQQFFEPELENVTYLRMTESQSIIKLVFSYSDGADLSLTNYKRLNRQEIRDAWKVEILNLVCVHTDLREQLQKGRKIEIDLRDGDVQGRASNITNMVIDNARC